MLEFIKEFYPGMDLEKINAEDYNDWDIMEEINRVEMETEEDIENAVSYSSDESESESSSEEEENTV